MRSASGRPEGADLALPAVEAWRARVEVVLVEPGDSNNIGGVARAMSNLGFRGGLRLVAPANYDAPRAEHVACWGAPLLRKALVYPSAAGVLPRALGDFAQVVGFTSQRGKHRPPLVSLAQWVGLFRGQRAFSAAPTALLFGPEDHGLTRRHLAECDLLVSIPSHPQNPSYNLAQAVLLVLYELLREAMLGGLEAPLLAESSAGCARSRCVVWRRLSMRSWCAASFLRRARRVRFRARCISFCVAFVPTGASGAS